MKCSICQVDRRKETITTFVNNPPIDICPKCLLAIRMWLMKGEWIMSGTPYPRKNSVITFLEPCPKKETYAGKTTYYIKASVNGLPEHEIRFSSRQHKETIDYLLKVDQTVLNAVVRVNENMFFSILEHSPQGNFFELVKEEKNDS